MDRRIDETAEARFGLAAECAPFGNEIGAFHPPPYLCGYWALKDKESYPATQIKDIVYQEMLHLALLQIAERRQAAA